MLILTFSTPVQIITQSSTMVVMCEMTTHSLCNVNVHVVGWFLFSFRQSPNEDTPVIRLRHTNLVFMWTHKPLHVNPCSGVGIKGDMLVVGHKVL